MTFVSTSRSFQRLALLLSLIGMVVACGDSGTEPVSVTGEYQLSMVNGKALPYRLFSDVGYTVDVTRSSLSLKADGSFLAALTSEERVEGNLSVYVDTAGGRWLQTGNTIKFTTTDSLKSTGTWTGKTLSVIDSGFVVPVVYLYAKP